MQSGACRVCLEDCAEKLACKCIGFAHSSCMREWMRARVQRGDALEDVRHCELCLARSTPSAGQWARTRIIMTRIVSFAALVAIGVESVTALALNHAWNGAVGGCLLVIMCVLYLAGRALIDSLCVDACMCSDVEDF